MSEAPESRESSLGRRTAAAGEAPLADVCASLLSGVREAAPDAWERLIDRFGSLVLSIPVEMGLDRADAEDAFQATWLALHRSLPRIREPGALVAWIMTTARRESLALLRSRARARHEGLENVDALAPLGDHPGDALEDLDRRLLVAEGLRALTERCRELLTELYFRAATPSYVEIAQALRMKVGSIGPTRMRCLAQLADWLEARGAR